MDSQSDSDLSEGMRELIGQGFAIKRGRERIASDTRYLGEPRAQVRDMDVSHVQRPLTLSVSAGVASTHGLTPATLEPVTAAGHNTCTQAMSTCHLRPHIFRRIKLIRLFLCLQNVCDYFIFKNCSLYTRKVSHELMPPMLNSALQRPLL